MMVLDADMLDVHVGRPVVGRVAAIADCRQREVDRLGEHDLFQILQEELIARNDPAIGHFLYGRIKKDRSPILVISLLLALEHSNTMHKSALTSPLASARSYSADSRAADKKSNTGILPFSVYVFSCDFSGTDLNGMQKKTRQKITKQKVHYKIEKKKHCHGPPEAGQTIRQLFSLEMSSTVNSAVLHMLSGEKFRN